MKLKQKLSRAVVAGFAQFACATVFASPVLCTPGFQDSTCAPLLYREADPQPQCSSGPGWTTVVASTWIGSQWSTPQCSYQPPPTCPAGYTETAPPQWNGTTWVGQVCAPPAPPPSASASFEDQLNACVAYGNTHDTYHYNFNVISKGGPYAGTGKSAFTAGNVELLGQYFSGSKSSIWYGKQNFDPPAGAATEMIWLQRVAWDVCWFEPGTTNILGFYNML
ncbi:hypothetical protein [Burkholderia sp. Ac-20365]|uniref:hypothetical protein n=1 Tax=Burkholderia sp. Ac-20365 TaxID=2703897 RepID=UPI00197B774F|nr:hypothetical protein [Burkholderia sp. Ac-20365]MBN3761093.1 hypothetical protein [Burkholderia sp. Ac-20365]